MAEKRRNEEKKGGTGVQNKQDEREQNAANTSDRIFGVRRILQDGDQTPWQSHVLCCVG